MRVLVIGGTGFIGPYVVRQLAALGHRVAVFHRGRTSPQLPPNTEQVLGDRERLSDFADEFRLLAPDVAIDFILSSARQARTLRDSLRGIAGRLVTLSSMDVYRACGVLHRTEPGPPDPVPLTEDSPLRTQPPYGPDTLRVVRKFYPWVDDEYDKVPVERIVMSEPALPATIIRLPMVYGPGDPGHRLFPILKRIADNRPAILLEEGLAHWRGPRGYVENVAAAITLAATHERAQGRVYHVAAPENFSELEWTRLVSRAADWSGRVLPVPTELAPPHLVLPYNAAQHWSADTTRIRRELGYAETIAWDEALRRTIAWERGHPPAEFDSRQFDYAAEDAALARLDAGYAVST